MKSEVEMTNRELGFELGNLVLKERKTTLQILNLINKSCESRAYLEHGFQSMFKWLTAGYKYSNAAAYRRLEAATLLRAVPQAATMLEAGDVNLTTLSKAQYTIKVQEAATGRKVTSAMKLQIVEKIRNKTAQDAEQTLYMLLPEAKLSVKREKKTVVDENTIRLSMNISNEMNQNIERAKEVLSHQMPNASAADVLNHTLKFFLDKNDKLCKEEPKRNTKAGAKRVIVQVNDGRCVFKDPATGHVCGSRHQVQIDHIIPKAMGGSDDPSNLRPLCREHNILMAEYHFGKAHMDQFKKRAT